MWPLLTGNSAAVYTGERTRVWLALEGSPLGLTLCGSFATLPSATEPRGQRGGSWGPGMIKSELVQLITEQNPHLRQHDVERVINTVFGEIIHALSLGDRVELRGFGAFSVREHEAKTGRNPRTGDAIEVAAKRAPHFKTGKDLRARLNASLSLYPRR